MNKNLSDIGEILLGHSFRMAIAPDPYGAYQVIQARNIGAGGQISSNDLVSTSLDDLRTKAFVQEGDVLLSNRGIFRAGLYAGSNQNLIAASSVYIIRLHYDSLISSDYLAVFLNSPSGQRLLESLQNGTLIKSLPKRALSNLSIPIPPVATQQLLVNVSRNYRARAALYERKSRLEESIAHQTISAFLSPTSV